MDNQVRENSKPFMLYMRLRESQYLSLSRLSLIGVLPLMVAGLSGCAKMTSIYRSETLPKDSPHIVSIDSKQRVVLTNPASIKTTTIETVPTLSTNSDHEGTTTKTVQTDVTALRLCAEPPPDVFTALAASLGAEASVNKVAAQDSAIATKLAAILAENSATIERTQTVNILREMMYRNCERYLSGAISQEEFIVQAARDQQLIIQVLAVEQITGIARAQSTALTSVAKVVANGVTDIGLETLASAKKDHETKRMASDKATKDATDLPPAGACRTSPIDVENPPSGVTADQAMNKNAQCDMARSAAKLAQEAHSYLIVVQEAVAKQGVVSSESQGKIISAAQAATVTSEDIATKVVEVVKQYQAFNEIGMTCVVLARKGSSLPNYCTDLMRQKADTELAQEKLKEAQAEAELVRAYRTESALAFDENIRVVWNYLKKSASTDKVEELVKKAKIDGFSKNHQARLADSGADLEKFTKAFARLPLDIQDKLARAAQSDY